MQVSFRQDPRSSYACHGAVVFSPSPSLVFCSTMNRYCGASTRPPHLPQSRIVNNRDFCPTRPVLLDRVTPCPSRPSVPPVTHLSAYLPNQFTSFPIRASRFDSPSALLIVPGPPYTHTHLYLPYPTFPHGPHTNSRYFRLVHRVSILPPSL